MKQKLSRQFLLVFITVTALLFQSIAVVAIPVQEDTDITPVTDIAENTLTEIVSLREESTKTFQKSDGGYVAAVYGEAVHYQDENGTWQEIDNTFSLTTLTQTQLANVGVQTANAKTAPVSYYRTTANPFQVNLPNTLNFDTPVTVAYQGYTLGFSLQGASAQTASIPVVASQNAELTATSTSIPNRNGVLTYSNVFSDTQLTYEMRGKTLKESLIFSKPPSQSSFTFRFYYTELFPKLLSTGEVHFYTNAALTGEPIFVIAAPYMFDSGEAYTDAVTVALEPCVNGCVYTLTPDATWLNDAKRMYPVTLDPTVSTSLTQNEIKDTSVHETNPTTNYINADRLYVGSVVLSSGVFESRTYIKFPRVSSIPTTAFILDATMVLNHHANTSYQSGSNNTIDVYDCGSNAWESGEITWNSQKNFTFTNLVCSRITDQSYSVEEFDVTGIVRQWYSTTAENNGLVIKPRTVYTNTSNRTGYYSSDISSSISSKRPKITIEYYVSPNSVTTLYNKTSYFLRNLKTGRYMTVLNGSDSSLTNVHAKAFDGSASQRWRLETISTYTHQILSGVGSLQKYLDVTGSNVDIYTSLPTYQTFRTIRYGNSNYYHIMYDSSFVSEDDTQNIVVSSSDLGAASLWSFEAVYAVDAVLYNSMLGNPLPPKYRLSGYTSMTDSEALALLRTSAVMIFNSHGSYESVDAGNGYLHQQQIKNLPNNELLGSKLVVYIACSCAEGGITGDNIVNATFNKGAAVVVGFPEGVGAIADLWGDGLMESLSLGNTIRTAMDFGDEMGKDAYGSYENLKSRVVRGNDLNTVLF